MSLVHYSNAFGPSFALGEVFSQLHRQLNRSFESQAAANSADSSATADWVPPADVAEFADRFVLQLDVPGVSIDAIDITLDQGVLAISGQRGVEQGGKEAKVEGLERSRIERLQGRFYRRFTLPDTVDVGAVKASSRDGILEVVIPKQPKAQPRRIEVAAA